MRPQYFLKAALVACLVGVAVMLAGPIGLAQQGPPQGKGGGGGGHTEAAVNNLSYPAVLVGTVGGTEAVPLTASVHVLGGTYSYGCDRKEMVGTFSYPNTTCASGTGDEIVYLDAQQCMATGAPCEGLPVDRIYWQKEATNYWKAETTGPVSAVSADYLDWGDNLESKSWTATSIIRVETTPFEHHLDATGNEVMKRGYQMWHVSGQGTDEQWGVRAQEVAGELSAVYAYDSPYSIIHTGNARLNIAKLSSAVEPCPSTYTPYSFGGGWTGTGWEGACTLKDQGFSAELNVGGKYVYGYNWAVRRDALTCPGFSELAGWWRLTFYTGGEVLFDNDGIPLTAPELPGALPETLAGATVFTASSESEEGDTGPLYRPVISKDFNLTYLDICITSGSGGGGKNR